MKLAKEFEDAGVDDIKAALDGGVLKIFTVARPSSPDVPVTRSDNVATFKFAAPAFSGDTFHFEANPVNADHGGIPGFVRAFKADGQTPVADFAAGPGDTDIKFKELTAMAGYPLSMVSINL